MLYSAISNAERRGNRLNCGMLISSIQPFTLLDYPGKTAGIIFTAGCNFRCGYCHNPEFVLPELLVKIKDSFIPLDTALNFFRSRQGLLEGVVVSGGEPTMQPDLLDLLRTLKEMNYLVKLDTNGNRPEVLRQALAEGLLDYVAMDYKTSCSQYEALAGPRASSAKIAQSRDMLRASGIDYEFRITLIKELHSAILRKEIADELRGAKRLFLQQFRTYTTLDPQFATYQPFSRSEMLVLADEFRQAVPEVAVRM